MRNDTCQLIDILFFVVSWALREALFTLKPEEAQPNVTLHVMNKFKSTGGGISFSGAILVFARPSFQLIETTPTNTPGYGKNYIVFSTIEY